MEILLAIFTILGGVVALIQLYKWFNEIQRNQQSYDPIESEELEKGVFVERADKPKNSLWRRLREYLELQIKTANEGWVGMFALFGLLVGSYIGLVISGDSVFLLKVIFAVIFGLFCSAAGVVLGAIALNNLPVFIIFGFFSFFVFIIYLRA